ncbi:serine/threonine protein kinase [Actinoplanes sp. NPDC051494]|uniref:serine/threonine protein kinase n=1 Tax=Actinoplanes sp. NPDC051494 TaxID=3363907 RepID=UPI00378CEA86
MPTRPLRSHDPRAVGGYELLRVLGEGGMGAVYLARGRDGHLVAVKIIRPEYAAQAEFRGRFRSEVNRARQVPPFCTAAVLDADPDHRTPYLVVEYVDGPDLAGVVADQGPLTGGALHSVAVGVATALVAIHGAGVIHRDLKPRNVLFALGSPKVIDFGIARAFESTSEHTRTDQMVGTLSYMAPERLDGKAVTPAVDVFAWGVLVGYAATGRTPFAADTPTVTAVRILTGEPDLTGLSGTLRDLVARTLAKDPAQRPTAQELLDTLLAAGPDATTAGSARRPAPPVSRPAPPASRAAPPERRARPRRRVARIAGAVVAAGLLAVAVPLGIDAAGNAPESVDAVSSPLGVVPASTDPALDTSWVDPLTADGNWEKVSTRAYSCTPGSRGLTIAGSQDYDGFTCAGPRKVFSGDHSVAVELDDLSPQACAQIRFRRSGSAGYKLEICRDGSHLEVTDPDGNAQPISRTEVRLTFPARHRIVIDIVDEVAAVRIDGDKVLATVIDSRMAKGWVELGMSNSAANDEGRALFADLAITVP